MGSKPSQHVFSVIDLTSMDTMNCKNFDFQNEYLERTRRPGDFAFYLIQFKSELGLHTPLAYLDPKVHELISAYKYLQGGLVPSKTNFG
jgi:hypothetical protein